MESYFILYVEDQARSRRFYEEALGLAPRLDVPGMTEFALPAGGVLGLMPEAGIKRLLGPALPDPARASGTPRAELYLLVQDPAGCHAQALEAGARELSPLQARNWGHVAAYSLDPDGHVLAFAAAVTLRRAGPADAAAFAACVMAAYERWIAVIGIRPGPMLENYAETLAAHPAFVAVAGDRVAGGVVLKITDEGFWLDNVAVDPKFAGQGIGKRLLAQAEEAAVDHGFDSIHLYTHERMLDNIALYRRLGYVEYARRTVGPYPRVFMRKRLTR
ncbi:MAG: GNAT family N-acetyltransferase [Rubrivivax sp.]